MWRISAFPRGEVSPLTHPVLWTECQHSDRFACRLPLPRPSRIGVSPTPPAISKLYSSIPASGTQIAFLVASSIFPVNGIRSRQASNVTATPDQETGRRQESNHETSIHSRLVWHSARAPSVDDIPVHSICAVAGALVSFSYFVS